MKPLVKTKDRSGLIVCRWPLKGIHKTAHSQVMGNNDGVIASLGTLPTHSGLQHDRRCGRAVFAVTGT
jgi:hypothetical protein